MRNILDNYKCDWHIVLCQILLFPIVVTTISIFSLVCRIDISAIQWWCAFAIVTTILPLLLEADVKVIISSGINFFLILLILWVLSDIFFAYSTIDGLRCHLPAVRLLIKGWNPFYVITPEQLKDVFDFGLGDAKTLHILFMPKAVWIFCASSFFFIDNQFNLFFPLYFFLAIPSIFYVWNALSDLSKGLRVMIISCLVFVFPWHNVIVDSTVAFAGIGAFCVIERFVLRKETRHDYLAVGAFTYWMIAAKPLSAIHAVVGWFLFLGFILWSRLKRLEDGRRLFKLFSIFTIVVALGCISLISPLLTSYHEYSHPLYPRYSVDCNKYPVHNLVNDFSDRNEDAKSMNYFEAVTNAYLSTRLISLVKWMSGDKDFRPFCKPWSQSNPRGLGYESPTTIPFRIFYASCFLCVLVFGSRMNRIMCFFAILLCMLMPLEIVGYLRYVPWVYLIAVVAVRSARHTVTRILISILLIFVTFDTIGTSRLFDRISDLENGMLLRCYLHNTPCSTLYNYSPYVVISPNQNDMFIGNLKLLRDGEKSLCKSSLVLGPDANFKERDLSNFVPFPDGSCMIKKDSNLAKKSKLYEVYDMPRGMKRNVGYLKYVCYCVFYCPTRSLIYRIIGV